MTRNRMTGLAVVVALVAGIAGARFLIADDVIGSEDNILFYMMGLNLIAADQLAAMADQAIAYYSANGADPHALFRLEFRKTYLNEFPLPGAIYLAVSRAYLELFEATRNLYPLFLAQTIVFGLSAAVLVAVVSTVAITGMTRRPWHLWALAGTVVLFAVVELLPMETSAYATIMSNNSFTLVMGHLGQLLAKPGPQFSPLGFTPRSHLALLMIAVFALRWSNRYGAAYLAVFVLSFVHLSSSAMVLMALLIVDLIARPHLFRAPRILIIVVAGLVVILARQTLWQLVGDSWPILAGGAAVVGIIGIAVWKMPAIRFGSGRALGWLAPLRQRLVAGNKVAADIRLLVVGWVLSFAVLYLVIVIFDPFDSLSKFYFWSRLHGRTLAIFWPSIVFGLIVLAMVRAARRPNRKPLAMAFCGLAIVATTAVSYPAMLSAKDGNVLVRVATDFLKADQRLYGEPMRNLRALGPEERVLYYGMVKSIDLNEQYLPLIMR